MKTLGYGHRFRLIRGLTVAFAILAAATTGLTGARVASAADDHPVILIFESVPGDGISRELAESATRAVRTYFRETRRVEAVALNAESPTVLRAVMEKKFTVESLKNDTARERRVEIAKLLGFEYAAAAELIVKNDLQAVMQGDMPKPPKGREVGKDDLSTVKADFVQVKLWLSKVDGGRKEQWETTQAAMISSDKDLDRDNAMQSAVSAAVLDLTRKAFAKVAPTEQTAIPNGDESAAITPEQPTGAAPTASDYAARGDESVTAGNIALAIQQYSQAVSADPSDGKLRVKLAEAYARKGLFDEAKNELDRALQIGVDRALIDASRARVEQIKAGETVPVAPKPETRVTTPVQPKPEPEQAPQLDPVKPPAPAGGGIRLTKDSVAIANARMIQGDKFWGKGELDNAALAYAEAAKVNPTDWRPHERLAAVHASLSLFGEARKSIEQLKKVQPNPPAETVEKRYDMFRRAFDRAFAMLITQLDSDTADFEKKVITRESYYAAVNGIGIRLDNMTKFLDSLTVPTAKQPANLRRSIACGLIAQATANILDHLETNNKQSKKNAETFIAQAKKETQEAAKLDANKVVIKKEDPQPATQPEPQPETQPTNTGTPTEPVQPDYWEDSPDQPVDDGPQPM